MNKIVILITLLLWIIFSVFSVIDRQPARTGIYYPELDSNASKIYWGSKHAFIEIQNLKNAFVKLDAKDSALNLEPWNLRDPSDFRLIPNLIELKKKRTFIDTQKKASTNNLITQFTISGMEDALIRISNADSSFYFFENGYLGRIELQTISDSQTNRQYNQSKNYPALSFAYMWTKDDKKVIPKYRATSVTIREKRIQDILTLVPANFSFINCYVENQSSVSLSGCDSITLDNIEFKDKSSKLKINGGNEFFKPVLSIRNCDLNHVEFNYSRFHYVPDKFNANYRDYDDWYSSIKKNYGDLIAMQKRIYSQEGIKAASIDSCIFEDNQYNGGLIFIGLKTWWNNYGYDKPRIIWSTIDLYTTFSLFNLLYFDLLIDTYNLKEISNAKHRIGRLASRYKAGFFEVLFSFIYTGYIFFGLRFDIKQLKLKSIPAAILVLFQYTVGVVCLGYIANLIITK